MFSSRLRVLEEFCVIFTSHTAPCHVQKLLFSVNISVCLGPVLVGLIDPVSGGLNPCCDAKEAP